MIFYPQKDIVLVPFSFTNGSTSKQRPVLIISNNTINQNDQESDFIALAITSKVRQHSYGLKIDNKDMKNGRLPCVSEIQCDKIATIQKNLVRKKLCSLNDTAFSQVQAKLTEVLGLSSD